MTTIQKLREMGIDPAPSQKSFQFAQQAVMLGAGLPVYNQADAFANVNAYVTSDDVYSIVRKIAKAATGIKRKVYVIKDEKSLKQLQNFKATQTTYGTRELMKERILRHKALEEVSKDNPLQKLIDNPNPEYAPTTFYEGCYTSRLLSGNRYLYFEDLGYGANAGTPKELWMLPPQYMSLIVSDTWPRRVLKYRMQITNIIDFDRENIIHSKYYNPLYNYVGNELIGLSPITAAAKIVTRQEAETDYTVSAFQNSGMGGIVTNKSIQGDEITNEALGLQKSNFYAETSGTGNAKKVWFTVGDVNYIPVTLSPADMNVLESSKMTFKKLCNVYDVSDRLFNNDATGSEISDDNARKGLYINAALPECYALDAEFNQYLVPKFNTSSVKYFVATDITEITELQDDMKDMATIFSTLPIMIPNVIAEAYGWDEIDDPDAEELYIKTGYTKLMDLGQVADIPLTNDTGN